MAVALRIHSVIKLPHSASSASRTIDSSQRSILGFRLKTVQNNPLQPSTSQDRKMDSATTTRATHPHAATVAVMATSSGDDEGDRTARIHHPLLDTINESTKWSVSAAVFSTLAIRRGDLMCSWWVLGSIIAAVLCRALKFALNQARPPTARKADPGMPSAHANSLGFLANFVALWAANSAPTTLVACPGHLLLAFGMPALGMFLTWLRVALGYHTVAQVAAGWTLGSSIAYGWWRLGIDRALPALELYPELKVGLYALTTAAVGFFILSNGGRWVPELRAREIKKAS